VFDVVVVIVVGDVDVVVSDVLVTVKLLLSVLLVREVEV
jgi:hypothetical protein